MDCDRWSGILKPKAPPHHPGPCGWVRILAAIRLPLCRRVAILSQVAPRRLRSFPTSTMVCITHRKLLGMMLHKGNFLQDPTHHSRETDTNTEELKCGPDGIMKSLQNLFIMAASSPQHFAPFTTAHPTFPSPGIVTLKEHTRLLSLCTP